MLINDRAAKPSAVADTFTGHWLILVAACLHLHPALALLRGHRGQVGK
jgi:hypothetical protein